MKQFEPSCVGSEKFKFQTTFWIQNAAGMYNSNRIKQREKKELCVAKGQVQLESETRRMKIMSSLCFFLKKNYNELL